MIVESIVKLFLKPHLNKVFLFQVAFPSLMKRHFVDRFNKT